MSEERFARIEAKLDVVVSDVSELKAGQARLVDEVSGLKVGQARLVDDVCELKVGQARLIDDVTQLQAGQTRTETRLDKLEINQEKMRDDIKLIAESHGALGIQMEKGFQSLHEVIDRRLTPLENAMRNWR
jgi:regulator of replication initiation timing